RDASEHAAGIVDQPVEAAEMLCRVLDHTGDVGRFREIALHEEDVATRLANLRGKLLRGLAALVVVQPDLRLLLGIGARQRSTYAGRGARDENGLAGEVGNGEGRHGRAPLICRAFGRVPTRPPGSEARGT